MSRSLLSLFALFLILGLFHAPATAEEETADDGYDMDEIVGKAEGFFGETTEGLAKAVEHVFEDHGRPNGYITGEEISAAIGVGLRYGEGMLHRKNGGGRAVFWQGPSIGFDAGGNASKVFVLVYHLHNTADIFQRFPRGRGDVLFCRRGRRELSAEWRHHTRADAHRCWPEGGREHRIFALHRRADLVAVLETRLAPSRFPALLLRIISHNSVRGKCREHSELTGLCTI